tara:strand:- start:49 stop:540 length:492 start_codon:yes stop_codon:yes gene_type:complete
MKKSDSKKNKIQYWLMKSEPESYSFDDLLSEPSSQACWDGVRNYQARNLMISMKIGDQAFFYHSNCKPPHIIGIVEIVRESYPDHTALDKKSIYYDAKASKENPRWFMVDVKPIKRLKKIVTLEELKSNPKLKEMRVTQKGQRLSVQPVEKKEFDEVIKMSNL